MGVPFTIWRFITIDLARLVTLTTAAFVFFLSFAATVKFFAEGTLSLADMLLFMLYACPTMLIYAMPFAALLAATLTYHRFEQDNERLASHAGGVSHRSLLGPALVAGVVIALTMYVINQEVAPRFLRAMEELVFERVGKVLVTKIESGEPITFDDWMIHADDVTRLEVGPEDGNIIEKFALTGVGAVRINESGEIETETTAGLAWVYLSRTGGSRNDQSTMIWLRLEEATTRTKGQGQGSLDAVEIVRVVPDRFDDNPKYLTRGESMRAYHDPDLLNVVDIRRRDLAFHEAQRRVIEHINRSMQSRGYATLIDPVEREWKLWGSGIVWEVDRYTILPGAEGIWFERALDATRVRRTTGEKATMTIDIGADRLHRELSIGVVMNPATTTDIDLDSGAIAPPGARTEWSWQDLSLTIDPLSPLLALSSEELMTEVAQRRLQGDSPDEWVLNAYRDLAWVIDDQKREIVSKQHERTSSAAACLVMVITGAVTALRLGRKLPLTAYLTSFFPAIASLVVISVGQQVGHSAGLTGILLMWSGVAGLAVFTLFLFTGLVRH